MAKKKYYQSPKDRRDEKMGAKKKSSKKENGYGYMIKADWNAPSLLPQQVMDRYWDGNNRSSYMDKYPVSYQMEDLYRGVDKQMKKDRKGLKKILNPSKY